MARWIFTLVLIYFIVRAITRFARGILEGMTPPREKQPAAVPLVRDPVCGTFVMPSRAVTAGSGADLRFFCSEQCRRTHEMKRARRERGSEEPHRAE
jgi:YHS domain-containing protein